jgi:putative transcriptional regulator
MRQRPGLQNFKELMMAPPRRVALLFAVLVLALTATWSTARPADLAHPLVLVAKPEVVQFYRGTVLFVRPIAGGGHLGVIVNRPTEVTLGELFPEHAPSQRVTRPVFIGGPAHVDTLFVLVQRSASPGGNSIELGDNLFLAFDVNVVDRIIEENGKDTRFLMGLVVWRPGELEREIRSGVWLLRDPDKRLVFDRSSDGLWEELVASARTFI